MGSLAAMQRSGGKGRYEVYVAVFCVFRFVFSTSNKTSVIDQLSASRFKVSISPE